MNLLVLAILSLTKRFKENVPLGDDLVLSALQLLMTSAMALMHDGSGAVLPSHFEQLVPLAAFFVISHRMLMSCNGLLFQPQSRGVQARLAEFCNRSKHAAAPRPARR